MTNAFGMYLLALFLGCLGFWSLQSGLKSKSPKQKMSEAMTPGLEWMNSKEKSLRIYIGILLLISSFVVLLK
jgi:hypothetical protein